MSGLTLSPKATSREACDQLLRLLSSFSQYNDASVCELLRLHPETCTVKYNFGYGNMDVYPLFQLVFLQASMQAIHLAYQAHPFAIYEPDQNGNFPLHVACASRASLEVLVQLVEWLPWAVKSTNAAGRTPLHLACHRHATLPVIRFLVWKYPLSLVMRAKDGCTPREDAAKAAVHRNAPNMNTPVATSAHQDETGQTEEEEEAILLEFLEYAETELDMALLERRSALEAAVKEWKAQSQLYGDDKAFALAATAQRHLTWMEPFLELLPQDDEDSVIAAEATMKRETESTKKGVKSPDKKRASSPDPPSSSDPIVEAVPVDASEEASPESTATATTAWSTNITVVASKEVQEEKKESEEVIVSLPPPITTKDLTTTTPPTASSSSFNWCAITEALGWCPMAAVDEEPVSATPPTPKPEAETTTTATSTVVATTEVTETTIRDAAVAITQSPPTTTSNNNPEANTEGAGDCCSSLEALEDEILPMIPPTTPPFNKRKARTVASPTNTESTFATDVDGIVQPPRTHRLVVVEDDDSINCNSPIMFMENALSGVGISPTPTNDEASPPLAKSQKTKSEKGTATAGVTSKDKQEADPIIYYEAGEEKKEPEVEDEITPQVSNASFHMSPKSADDHQDAVAAANAAARSASPLAADGTTRVDNDLADFLASVGLQITNEGLVNPVLPPSSPDDEEDFDEDANSNLASSTNNDPPAQVISTHSKTFEDETGYDEVEEERSHGAIVNEINRYAGSDQYNTYEVSEEDLPEYNYNDEYHLARSAAAAAATPSAAVAGASDAAVQQAQREVEEVALSPRRNKFPLHPQDQPATYSSPGKQHTYSSPGNRSIGVSDKMSSPVTPLTVASEAFAYQTPTRHISRTGIISSNNSSTGGNTTSTTTMMHHREQMVRAWLLKYLPTLREEDLSVYASRLVDDGFDSVDMLENELMEEDLDFMRKAHKRSIGRKKFLESEGY